MAYVLKREAEYIRLGNNKKITKTENYKLATQFDTEEEAVECLIRASKKCKGFLPVEVTAVEPSRVQATAACETDDSVKTESERTYSSDDKRKRRIYSQTTRELIYFEARGRCALCGKKLAFEDMTLDHIIPLSKGGMDDISNLQCTCSACNGFKRNFLPQEFTAHLKNMFIYQTDKHQTSLKWRIARWLLKKM